MKAKSIASVLFRNRKKDPPAMAARRWSNKTIKNIGTKISGSVINVSAWKDEDKEGGLYKDYFSSASSYCTSNYQGWRGADGRTDHELDLRSEAPVNLRGKFDLVFNHTTLEHTYDIQRAFKTMCELSRDAMLIVVPFMQHLHGPKDGDFWRPSPYAMRRMFQENDFDIIHESAGPEGGNVRYLVYFASSKPDRWKGRILPGNDAVNVLRSAIK